MDIGKYSHITPALYDLHWLPIHARIHFQILLLAFKAIHGQAPAYLSSLVSRKSKSYYRLRSNCSTLLDPPKGKMQDCRAFILGGRTTIMERPTAKSTRCRISWDFQEKFKVIFIQEIVCR